VIRATETGHTK